ncbi:MAG: Lrp/AsnC family transcriptional regulator [Thaumarchaeota archaeon]|jgi:DNA-binding Lrp family transcriptional regulator|nr:Lrp/AsnC family transcriptional regulator [Nitrososphaerota archaeon]
MPIAFVMINAELGSEKALIKELRNIEGVVEANEVYGVYDIVVKVDLPTMDKLKEVISRKIRGLSGVRSTLTMMVIE